MIKWRQVVYTKKSKDRFLNKISNIYGEEAVIAYGDWSRKTQMKHFVPTKGYHPYSCSGAMILNAPRIFDEKPRRTKQYEKHWDRIS